MNLYKAIIFYWKPSIELSVLKENVKFTTDRDREIYESDGGFCDYIYRDEGNEVDVLVYAKNKNHAWFIVVNSMEGFARMEEEEEKEEKREELILKSLRRG
jgi:inorganic pyrophosphatase